MKHFSVFAATVLAGSLFIASPLYSQNAPIVVNSLGDEMPDGMGGFPDDGITTLREAIKDAEDAAGDDVILFDSSLEEDISFPFLNVQFGALVIGGNGKVTVDGSALSTRLAVDALSTSRVFEVPSGTSLELIGIEVSGGKASNGADGMNGAAPSNGGDGQSGGGIFNEGDLVVRSCRFLFNEAGNGGKGGDVDQAGGGTAGSGGNGGNGGAIASIGTAASLAVVETEFSNNDAGTGGAGGAVLTGFTGSAGPGGDGGGGGGIFCAHGDMGMADISLLVDGCFFTANNTFLVGKGGLGGVVADTLDGAPSGNGGHGGGIFSAQTKFQIVDTAFVNNAAGDGGGSAFGSGRVSGGNGGDGGGIYASGFLAPAESSIARSLFWRNDAGSGGPGMPVPSGAGSDGGNAGRGGGVFVASPETAESVFRIENCTFNENDAGELGAAGTSGGTAGTAGAPGKGGGLAFGDDTLAYEAAIVHSTIVANSVGIDGGSEGGGIWEATGGIGAAGSGVSIANSIVAENVAVADAEFTAGILQDGNNLVGGDPVLQALDTNHNFGDPTPFGGPTQTMAPLAGSPAINAGADLAEPLLEDQRGFARPAGGRSDLGAFELALQPDAKVGTRSNPNTHRIDNVYRANAVGQTRTIRLRGTRLGRAFFSVENDGDRLENPLVRGNRANRALRLSVFRLTGGRRNVSGAIVRGIGLESWDPGDAVVFRVDVRRRSTDRRARGSMRYLASSREIAATDAVRINLKQVGP